MGTSWLLLLGSHAHIQITASPLPFAPLMPKLLLDQAQLDALVTPVCAAAGVDLVQVRHLREPEGTVLRVLIELPGAENAEPGAAGITLEDCRRVSRALSDVLDADELIIPGQYRLEVSSPGVERPLVKAVDFERYAGREVQVSTKAPIEGRKNFSGILGGLRGDQVLLRDSKGEDLALPLDGVAKAHLVFRF
jgi:ribosome maturation factor RimP